MGFHEVDFPLPLAYGTAAGPGFATQYVQTLSGAIHRRGAWADPLHVYNVRDAVQNAAAMEVLKAFYIARRGGLNGFRFKDPADFTTGPQSRGTPTASDVLLGTGDGVTREFQAVKRYAPATDWEWARTLRKLVAGSVVVSVNGTPTTAFVADTATGKVLMNTAPAAGAVVRFGCEFRVPVIFGPEAGQLLSVTFQAFNDERIAVPLIEDRADYAQADALPYGGAQSIESPSADTYLSPTVAKVWEIYGSPSNGSGWRLPDPAGMKPGGVHFVLANSTSVLLPVREVGGTTLYQAPAQTVLQVYLSVNPTTGVKRWLFAR